MNQAGSQRQRSNVRRGRGLVVLGAALVLGTAAAVAGPVTPQEPATPASAAAATPAASAAAPQSPAAVAPLKLPSMSPEALVEHQARHADHLLVLDVRSPEEFREGHVPGAVNLPYDQVAARIAEVPRDKDVVLYCRSGRRAGLAAEVLAANGYTRLSHLEGDMQAWIAQGRPVAKP